MYVNKENNEKVIYPRIGAFEIYIFNVLISSKLLSNQWPNHYKILQILNKIIEEKKKGHSLEPFSVYNPDNLPEAGPSVEQSKETGAVESPDKRHVRITSKKKKGVAGLTSKAYKSIDRSNQN